jgi:hypothetical protein
MIIYGNSGQDIRRMIWKKKFKLLSIIVVIAVAVMLMGCTTATKQAKLGDGMNKFWDSLGGKVPTKSKDE